MRPEVEFLKLCMQSVPERTSARARLHVLDWLGVVVAARGTPQARAFEVFGGIEGEQLVCGALHKSRTAPSEAAFLLGGLGNILEMDDLHKASIMHVGNTVIPAAIVVALSTEASGRRLLDAIARGYEAAIRIGLAAAASGYRPFMTSTTCGIFGAAVAAADLLELDDVGVANALAQASMSAGGVWQCRLEKGFSKQVASANATRCGVEAAFLADAGFAGPGSAISGPLGFLAAYFPKADPKAIAVPANDWKLHGVSFKPWPACRHSHPAISAALVLAHRIRARGEDVSEIRNIKIRTYAAAIDFCDCPNPISADEARFSFQHAVAVALLQGAPRISDFDVDAPVAEPVAALRARVTLEEDPDRSRAFPGQLSATVSCVSNGETIVAETDHAPGDPENPMCEADLIVKFQQNAAHAGICEADAAAIYSAAMNLASLSSPSDLARSVSRAYAKTPVIRRAS